MNKDVVWGAVCMAISAARAATGGRRVCAHLLYLAPNVNDLQAVMNKGKGMKICIAPLRENLTADAHSFYTANTPSLSLPRKRSPGGATTSSNKTTRRLHPVSLALL